MFEGSQALAGRPLSSSKMRVQCVIIACALVADLASGAGIRSALTQQSTLDGTKVAAAAVEVGAVKKAVPAPKKMVNFAFGGSALLLPYYLGVMEQLNDLGVVRETTLFGGISGGAITSLAGCAGANMTELLGSFQKLQTVCTTGEVACGQGLKNMEALVLTDKLLNDNLAKCGQGRVRVGMTALNPTSSDFKDSQALTANKFFDSADMRSAIAASSYLGCISGPQPYTFFRGMPVIDGGYKADYPDICPPDGPCVRVASFA
jgi:hypothetical protein